MAHITVSSTNSASPTTVYSGGASRLLLLNPDQNITIYVQSPNVNSPSTWADIPPNGYHYFLRKASEVTPIVAYASAGTPTLIINEVG